MCSHNPKNSATRAHAADGEATNWCPLLAWPAPQSECFSLLSSMSFPGWAWYVAHVEIVLGPVHHSAVVLPAPRSAVMRSASPLSRG